MQNITIPIEIPSDLFSALNESENDIRKKMLLNLAVDFFEKGKITIGKASQLAGLNRYEFENYLAARGIPVIAIDETNVFNDLNKLRNF